MKKIIVNKLEITKRKVSKKWSKYRTVKKQILKRKNLSGEEKKYILASKRDEIKTEISSVYKSYREFKHEVVYKSPFEGFKYTQTIKTARTTQKIFRAKTTYNVNDLDNVIPKLLNQPNVTGVLIVFSIESEETKQRSFISTYINSELLKRIDQPIYNYAVERFQVGNTKDYKLKFIYLRVIYASTKKS